MAQVVSQRISESALTRKHELMIKFEQELGATVERLEAARSRQVALVESIKDENTALRSDIKCLNLEMKELREVNEELREKLKSMKAEAEDEGIAKETLKMKLLQSVKHAEMTLSVERRLGGELKSLNVELEQRCTRQQADITQLRRKIEQMTTNLNELSQSNDHETIFRLRQDMEKLTRSSASEVSMLKAELSQREKQSTEYKAELTASSLEVQNLRKKLQKSYEDKCKRSKEASAELLQEREQSVKLLQSNNKLQAETEMLKKKVREYEAKERDAKLASNDSSRKHSHPSLDRIEEEPLEANQDVEPVHTKAASKPRSIGPSPSFFESYFDEPSEYRSPASAMIKELLALESKGQVLSNNQVLQISEKYARSAVGYEYTAEEFDGLEIEPSRVVLIPTSRHQHHQRALASTGTKLRPSAELTSRFQRRKTPPKVKKDKSRKSKGKVRKSKAHVKQKGGEAQSRRQTKASMNIENVPDANTRQRNTWRY